MNMYYRFTSDEEPTEEQLAQLMHEVAVEAKDQAEKAHKKMMEEIREAIIAASKREKQIEEYKGETL